jgi:hypothetical protein
LAIFSKQLAATLRAMISLLKNYKWFVALTLSLVLGLSSVVVSAHSHFDSLGEHQSLNCDICILPSLAATASIDTAIDHPVVQKTLAVQIGASIPRSKIQSTNPARAPPQHL